jgi:hypothetical protein
VGSSADCQVQGFWRDLQDQGFGIYKFRVSGFTRSGFRDLQVQGSTPKLCHRPPRFLAMRPDGVAQWTSHLPQMQMPRVRIPRSYTIFRKLHTIYFICIVCVFTWEKRHWPQVYSKTSLSKLRSNNTLLFDEGFILVLLIFRFSPYGGVTVDFIHLSFQMVISLTELYDIESLRCPN